MLLWKHPWLKGVPNLLSGGWLVKKRLLMDFCDFRLISVQFTCWISVTGGGVISSFLWLLPFWCERAAVSCDVTLLLTQLQPVWQQCDQCDTLCDNLAVLCRHDIVQLQTNYCRTQFDNSAPPFCTIVSAVLYQTHCIWGICLILLGNVENHKKVFCSDCHLKGRGENCFIFWTSEGCSGSWKQLCLLHSQSINIQWIWYKGLSILGLVQTFYCEIFNSCLFWSSYFLVWLGLICSWPKYLNSSLPLPPNVKVTH